MKKNSFKLLFIVLLVFFVTGCTKQLTDENKRVVKYEASRICESCKSTCDSIDNVESMEECTKNCNEKCELAKKNETGQNLTKNILCRPTNGDVIELYEMYGVDISSLNECKDYKAFSSYEGLWISIFVRPLAWLLIKTGILLNNSGLGLIIISVLIRVALMPFTRKTAMQSENLKKAQPDIDRINKKYENKTDQESQMAKNQEILMVYKKYDINPLSSCLFAFIQIPLLFAFIEAINRTPAIFEGKFLGLRLGLTPFMAIKSGEWWYLILVVVLGIITYFSLNMNKGASIDTSDNGKQVNTMNKIMLIFIVYASFTLSTAICLYWISSSACTIVQNILVKRDKK